MRFELPLLRSRKKYQLAETPFGWHIIFCRRRSEDPNSNMIWAVATFAPSKNMHWPKGEDYQFCPLPSPPFQRSRDAFVQCWWDECHLICFNEISNSGPQKFKNCENRAWGQTNSKIWGFLKGHCGRVYQPIFMGITRFSLECPSLLYTESWNLK